MSWYSIFFFISIMCMRNDVDMKRAIAGASHEGSLEGPQQQDQVSIAIVTSDNLTEVQTIANAALEDLKRIVNTSQINTQFYYLEKTNANLDNSLVRFCRDVVSRNVTAVIMTDKLKKEQLYFIPWIASYLGIPVTLLRDTRRGFSNHQNEEYNKVYSLKPDILQQTNIVSGILSFFRWTHVMIISEETKSQLVNQFVKRLEASNPILMADILTIDTSNSKDIADKLAQVKKLDTSAIVLICEASEARKVLIEAEVLGLFKGDRGWIVSEAIVEGLSGMITEIPSGLLGIRLRRTCNTTAYEPLFDVVYDGLMVNVYAQQSLINKGTTSPRKHSSCYGDIGNMDSEGNTAFFRHILATKLTGKTGPIQFDNVGNRINPAYDIVNLQAKANGEKEWTNIGHWINHGLVCNKVPIQWPGKRVEPPPNILHTKVLRVATAITEPFAFFSALKEPHAKGSTFVCASGFPCKVYQLILNGSYTIEQRCCKGFVIDLLGMLENDLGFKADLHVVKDGKYGALDKGKWNGLIGELVRGEADLAIADLTVTDLRSRAVDFTQPFLHSGTNILVAVRINRTGWVLRFLEPFTTELWILLVATINIIVILLWIIDRKSPYGHYRRGKDYKERKKFHLIASLWFSWGTVFHIDECEARPRSYSSRLITVVFAFAMLVLTNTYTANLAAVLVSEGEVLPISGIKDPKLQNPPKGFTVGTVADTSLEKVFQRSEDAVYSQIWRNMKGNSVKTFSEGVQNVIKGELTAFIGDEPTLLYNIGRQESCNLKLAGKSFFQSGFGLALQKNSTLTKRFSKVLMQYEQLDTSRKLSKRWLRGSCGGSKDGTVTFKGMTIDDVGGGFTIVLVGVVVSILVLAIEVYVDRFGFPLSHIWTNKPHRSWPSTRELYRKGMLGNQSEAFSLAPLELNLSERRVTPSIRGPWNSLIDTYNPPDKINNRLMPQDFDIFSDKISRNSFNVSHTHANTGFDEESEEQLANQDSGRSSLSIKKGKPEVSTLFTHM